MFWQLAVGGLFTTTEVNENISNEGNESQFKEGDYYIKEIFWRR